MEREPVAGKRERTKQGEKIKPSPCVAARHRARGPYLPSLSRSRFCFSANARAPPPTPPPVRHPRLLPPVAMETAFKVATGNGNPTSANLHAAGMDVLLQVVAEHWLAVASGGVKQFKLREVKVAFTASFYFANAALPLAVNQHAWSLPQLAASLQTALDHGLSTDNRGSVRAALYYFVSFCRAVRAQHPSDFTVDQPTAFMTLPAHADAALEGDSA